MTTTERVILIQGDTNKWYEQAIFIVKPDIKKIPTNIIDEAEQIIAAYLVRNRKPLPANFPATRAHAVDVTEADADNKKRTRKGADIFMNVLMFLGCVALALVIVYGMVMFRV